MFIDRYKSMQFLEVFPWVIAAFYLVTLIFQQVSLENSQVFRELNSVDRQR